MSRLIINNKENFIFEKAVEYSRKAGLNKFKAFTSGELNIAVFEKRNISFGNVFWKNDNEYAVATGSLLYKGQKGVKALELILEDFNGDIIRFKKECLGIYSLLIRKNSCFFLLSDYYGLYDLYYYQDASYFFIGNSLSTLVTVNDLIEINEEMLMADCIGCGHFDSSDSFFKNVYRLRGNEYIEIKAGELRINEICYDRYAINYEYESEEKAIQDILQVLSQSLPDVKCNFEHIAINLTGGLDSRCSLAAFYQAGCDVRLLYGRGRKGETITCENDRAVVQNIADKFKLPLYYMNWEEQHDSEVEYLKRREYFFQKYGFIDIYEANDRIRLEYEGRIQPYPEFMDFGYFGESFRLREWVECGGKEYFTIESFINEYLFRIEKDGSVGWELKSLKEILKRDITKWIVLMKIPIIDGLISVDYFERLRWVAARFGDSRMAFFVNEFTYSFPIYGIPQIHEILLSLPAHVTRNGVFQIKFLKTINPEFLNGLMLFSHRRLYRITDAGEKLKVVTFKNIADVFLHRMPVVASLLKSIYRRLYYNSYKNWKDDCVRDLKQINVHLLDMQDVKNRDVFYSYNYFLACYAEMLKKRNR
jgi:hypothetical protein